MTLTITLATASEREWAAGVMAGAEPWITLKRDLAACTAYLAPAADSELLIARDGATPAGFLLARARGLAGSPYIASIAVAENYRSSGVGSAMLAHVEARYVPPARHIFLCVSSFNARARQLYERIGYAVIGDIPDYLVAGQNELIMHKRLTP